MSPTLPSGPLNSWILRSLATYAGELFILTSGNMTPMRSVVGVILVMMVCLSMPGCSGTSEPEYVDVICEETAVVSFDNRVVDKLELSPFECGFNPSEPVDVEIEVIGNNDFPVSVITTGNWWDWYVCGDFDYYSNLTMVGVVNASLIGEVEAGWNYVFIDVPYSCDTPPWSNTTSIITGSDLWSGNTYGSYLGALNSTSYYPVFVEEGRSATVELVGGDDLSRFYPCSTDVAYPCDGAPGLEDESLYVEGYTYWGYVYTAQSDEWRISFSGDAGGEGDVIIQEVKGVATFDVRVTISCDCLPFEDE
mgnify:FL=1